MKTKLTKLRKGHAINAHCVLALIALTIMLVAAAPVAAQYGDSYSRMLSMTSTWNQNLYDQQNRLNEMTARAPGSSSGTVYGQAQSQYKAPARQFPITATDFTPVSGYMLPDEFAKNASGVKPEDREELRGTYIKILSAFEREARKNNMANAFAFVVGTSIQVIDGKELSDAYVNNMIGYFNSRLAGIPQYNTMAPKQKQTLYESMVLTGGIIAFLDAQGKATNNTAMRTQARDLSRAVIQNFLGIKVQ